MDDWIYAFSKSLKRLDETIWGSRNKSIEVSFPSTGYDFCYQLEENSFWFKHRNNCILKVLQKYPPHGLFFDIGGGNGFVSKRLQDSGYEVVLVEPGINGALNAKSRGLKKIICSTLEESNFKSRSIPAVGLFDVLEHIKNDVDLLKKIHRLLKPRGRLYITVPAHNYLWSEEDSASGHFRRYSLGSLREILTKAGFQIEYETYIFSFFNLPILLLRTIPYKLKLRKVDPSRTRKELSNKSRMVEKIINKILAVESSWVGEKRIPIGASCLVVARKD